MRKVIVSLVILVVMLLGSVGTVAKANGDLDFYCAWLSRQEPKPYIASGSGWGWNQYDVLPCAYANKVQLDVVGDSRADYRLSTAVVAGPLGSVATANRPLDPALPGALALIAGGGK